MTDLRDQLQAGVGGFYAIERELGGGGMSRVFVATEHALGRQVVLKALPANIGIDMSAERFAREIALAAGLQHPCIVPVLTAGVAHGIPYYTMPYVDGQTLRDRLVERKRLPVDEAVGVSARCRVSARRTRTRAGSSIATSSRRTFCCRAATHR